MSVRILKGDAVQILRTLSDQSFDAVIADPPYSSGGFTRSDRSSDPADKYVQSGTEIVRASFSGDNRDARSWCFWCALWISECLRVVREGGYFLMFTDWRQLPLASDAMQAGGFVWRGIVAWDKTEGARAPHTGYFRHQCEYVVWGSRGTLRPAAHGGPWPGCIRASVKQSEKVHMTGKPLELMARLVEATVPPGGSVLDPFAGSGSTGLAADRVGRHATLIELEPHYVRLAEGRIRGDFPMFADVDVGMGDVGAVATPGIERTGDEP